MRKRYTINIFLILLLLLLFSIAFWSRYADLFAACRKSGMTPDQCHEVLR
jgi:hypothetical protein